MGIPIPIPTTGARFRPVGAVVVAAAAAQAADALGGGAPPTVAAITEVADDPLLVGGVVPRQTERRPNRGSPRHDNAAR